MFGDLGKLMALIGKVKTELPAMKEKLARSQFSAEAGGGAVWACTVAAPASVTIETSGNGARNAQSVCLTLLMLPCNRNRNLC